MRIWACLLTLLFVSAVASAEIQIFNPADQLLTFDQILMLKGKTSPGQVKIERIPFATEPDGSFSCGLLLNPGKNLIAVQSGEEIKKVRVVRLVNFPDIEEEFEGKKHWARGQIVYLSTLGIIEGYPDGNFYPANPVTRGELATWLAKVKKLPLTSPLISDPFFDVPKEHWRAPYVKAVTEANLLPAYSKETFGIDDPISRREAAEMIVRVEGLDIVSKIIPLFRDVPKEESGAAPIYTARESGLVIGVSKKIPIYDPERALTRAEAATLISRFSAAQAGIRYLSDFGVGYTDERFCKLDVPPRIISFSAEPKEIPRGQALTIKLRAQVASRESFSPLAKVKVDLSGLGGMPDVEMFDDGTHGDEIAGDGIYSLNFSLEPKESGGKYLSVTATDRIGWEGKQEISIIILE